VAWPSPLRSTTSRSGTNPPLDNRAQATRHHYDSMLGQAPGPRPQAAAAVLATPGRDAIVTAPAGLCEIVSLSQAAVTGQAAGI
jgi:hypothetical protein